VLEVSLTYISGTGCEECGQRAVKESMRYISLRWWCGGMNYLGSSINRFV